MNEVNPEQNMLTVKDLARILNCGRTKAWELVNTHQIRTVRVGRLVRLERKAIEEFIEKNREGEKEITDERI